MDAKAEIAAIEAGLKRGRDRINEIRKSCQHEWVPTDPSDMSSSSPVCSKCGDRGYGWWCQESPTKECQYELSEYCTICHQPSERK